ncbi:MAG: FkbM family methyltransferase [Planctomycetaceae bacterium]|nr:FkbM family methyltransferase [Planctomycetaceae bacterium]MCA9084332.1 FkbM family methyltransferase [Planctomycetaceae bacterium]
MLRQMDRLYRLLGWSEIATVNLHGKSVCVRMFDSRLQAVVDELRGQSRISIAIRTFLNEGDTFLDIGANHGSYSILAASILKGTGRIVAFEPFLKLAECVEKSLTLSSHNCWDVMRIALSDKAGTCQFYFDSTGSGTGSVFGNFSDNAKHSCTVEMTPLDSITEQLRVVGSVLIKLDVEGSEFNVLNGARGLLRRFRPTIILETNPESASAAGHSLSDLVQLLAEEGYTDFIDTRNFAQTLSVGQLDLSRQGDLVAVGGQPAIRCSSQM